MHILPNIGIVDLALYFDSVLVISDVHIGYEEALNKQGVLVPRLQFEEMVKRLNNIFALLKDKKIKTIVVNGDLKHEFGIISEQEWRNSLKFIDLLAKHCEEIVLIKGNHDTILGPIARKRNVKVLDYFIVEAKEKSYNRKSLNKSSLIKNAYKKIMGKPKNKILIVHGNKIPPKELLKDISIIVIGHEHPAISLKSGPRVERFKCFLNGKYKGKNLIVQPSFNSIIEGTNILNQKILSPFLKQNLDKFEVYIVEDKVYEFGKLGSLRKN